jgi:hypothetical protein
MGYGVKRNKVNPLQLVTSNLIKYNINQEEYNVKVINDLIYDERKHLVATFKEHLIWDDMAEFLIRYFVIIITIGFIPLKNVNVVLKKFVLILRTIS